MADVNPGSAGSEIWWQVDAIVSLDDVVYFAANDGIHGRELWSSDGTGPGTHLVQDIFPGSDGSGVGYGSGLTVAGQTVYFAANDGIHGYELWASDATVPGARLVADIWPGAGWSGLADFAAMGDTLFFAADDSVHGRELWRSDGSDAGSRLVKDVRPGAAGAVVPAARLTAVDDTLYLWLDDGAHGFELWRSDGSEAGTTLVKDIRPGLGGVQRPWPELAALGSTLIFTADDNLTGIELWRSDGSEAGTYLVKDIRTDNAGSHVHRSGGAAAWGESLFFAADDQWHGNELWASDGTELGTRLVDDILPENDGAIPLYASIVTMDDSLYFPVDDGVHGVDLWASTGAPGGSRLVADIAPGSMSSFIGKLFAFGQTLYLSLIHISEPTRPY